MSLLTSLFDGPFPRAVPYFFQIAALAGFGQIWVNYAFLFFVEARFYSSILYLAAALIAIVAVNLHIAINRNRLGVALAFLGSITIPTGFISFFSVSAYVNGLAVWIPPLPIVPLESIYIVLITYAVILGFSIVVSVEPGMLKKMFGAHRKRWFVPSLLNYATNPTDDPKENKKGGGK
ncbi:MAG: hypothetical protein QMD13_00795 [Candidatus Bathyarchaeia archaeon]|nr:hypothetical protein [Candidatus Bathyarchaeia archaeon]